MKKTFEMRVLTPFFKLLSIALFATFFCACGNDNNDSTITETVAVLDSVEFSCKKGDLNIYGLMYTKVTPGKKAPAVILSHSSSLTHAAMRDYARQIANLGMVAYCFDFCGGSSESKSDGSTEDMTVFTKEEDLKTVLAAVSKLDIVDADSIYLLGSSEGGLVSALVAEDCPKDVRGLILFYPAFNIPDLVNQFGDLMNQWGNWGNLGNLGNLRNLGGMSMSMSETYINAIKDYDVWSNIGTYPNPVTIIHGSADIIVPISNSERAVKLYPDAKLHVIEGANHGFNAANLGSLGSMMGASADYDNQVLPIVFQALHR